jgi:putative transposase
VDKEIERGIRKSKMFLGETYFWTDTVKDWKRLLEGDTFKSIIIDSWRELVARKKIEIHAFVIMPNHIHNIWTMLEKNGNEMPHASFNKFTAHQFLENLKTIAPGEIKYYKVDDPERKHRFWQRDALAVLMDYESKLEQKLDYIHRNPLQKHWKLAGRPQDYKWSSAAFYKSGDDEFGILTDYRKRFSSV